ncbi:MAG: stilbene synthase [Opitutaceae bacterium]
MYLHALATAVPPDRYTQAQCWDMVQHSEIRKRLSRKSLFILQAVLTGDSGIDTRHFAARDVERILDLDSDQLNESFRLSAPQLAAEAVTTALARAGVAPEAVDALLVCTCTGYLCPGVSSYVAERLGLRENTFLQDLVGLGCGAAIPTLRAADALLAAQPDAVVVTVAVEVCSSAFYLDDDLGVLFSACLFGDGAAAAVWRSTPGPGGWRCHGFDTLHRPADRDRIRFEQRGGKLRNLLHPSVPQLAAAAVSTLHARASDPEAGRPLGRVLSHTGGRDVLRALETALPGQSLRASKEVLRRFGNMSSPSVLFALANELEQGPPSLDEDWWLVGFGAGFSAHSCRFGG